MADKHSEKTRVVLLLEYLGHGFSGSQYQTNAISVQQTLMEALEMLCIETCGGKPIFAGRTDAGVHAKGQVAHIDCVPRSLDRIKNLQRALNVKLPETMSVKDLCVMPNAIEGHSVEKNFHALLSAQWRWYQYKISNTTYRSSWCGYDTLWFDRPLDIEKMNEAASYILGQQDFKSFKCVRSDIKNNICNIIYNKISTQDQLITFDIVGNRFLYKMVRNIAGTLLEIGSNPELQPDQINAIMAQKDRQSAGPTAPACGLTFMAITYRKPWDFFQNDVYVKTLTQAVQEFSNNENILCQAS